MVGDFGCSCIWAFFAASLLLQGNKAGLRISRSSCGLSLRNASANLPQGMVPSTTSYEFTHPFTHLSTHPSIYSFKRCLLSCILRVCTRLWVQSLHPEEGDRQLAQKTMVGGITRLPPNAHQERTYAGLMGPGDGRSGGLSGDRDNISKLCTSLGPLSGPPAPQSSSKTPRPHHGAGTKGELIFFLLFLYPKDILLN